MAFVALHSAERLVSHKAVTHPIERLVLLAPALDFGAAGMQDLGEAGLARWKADGWLEIPHYAYGESRRVHYELYSDASRHDSFATSLAIPTLILQGRHDEIVDPAVVQRFAATRPHVRLVMLDDGHQLKESLECVWSEMAEFLGIGRGP